MTSGPDIGRCVCFNLRTGMLLSIFAQVIWFGFMAATTFLWFESRSFDMFYFATGAVMNSSFVILISTGFASSIVGIYTMMLSANPSSDGSFSDRMIRRKRASQAAQIWYLLSFMCVFFQFSWGAYYSYRCLQVVRDTTPSLIAFNGLMKVVLQKVMEKTMSGMNLGALGGGMGGAKKLSKDAVDKLLHQYMTETDKESIAILRREAEQKKKKSWFGFDWVNAISTETKVGLGVAFILGMIVALALIGALSTERQQVRQWLAGYPPMADLYISGENFIGTFALYSFLPGIFLFAVALHVGAYSAILEKGGVGDEMVGYTRLRWFYHLKPEERRMIRAGKTRKELRQKYQEVEEELGLVSGKAIPEETQKKPWFNWFKSEPTPDNGETVQDDQDTNTHSKSRTNASITKSAKQQSFKVEPVKAAGLTGSLKASKQPSVTRQPSTQQPEPTSDPAQKEEEEPSRNKARYNSCDLGCDSENEPTTSGSEFCEEVDEDEQQKIRYEEQGGAGAVARENRYAKKYARDN